MEKEEREWKIEDDDEDENEDHDDGERGVFLSLRGWECLY
jgi:hypothetical protein